MSTTEQKPAQAQGGGAGSPQGEGTSGGPGGASESKDDVLSAEQARKLRSENYELRQRLKQAEAALEEAKKGEQTELQKRDEEIQKQGERLAALERRNRSMGVQVAAGRLGIVDPEAADKLLDWDKIDNPADEQQIEQALQQLVKDKPYLTRIAGAADGGARGQARPTDMNDVLRRAAGRAS